MEAGNEHKYQELLKTIQMFQRHFHADGSPAFVTLSGDIRPNVAENVYDRRIRELEEANERRHQELLSAINLLYCHVHDEEGRVIIPAEDSIPTADDD